MLGHHYFLDRDVSVAEIAFHLHQWHVVRHVQKGNGPLRFIQLHAENREKWGAISGLYRVEVPVRPACIPYPPVLGHADRVVVSRRLRMVPF